MNNFKPTNDDARQGSVPRIRVASKQCAECVVGRNNAALQQPGAREAFLADLANGGLTRCHWDEKGLSKEGTVLCRAQFDLLRAGHIEEVQCADMASELRKLQPGDSISLRLNFKAADGRSFSGTLHVPNS